MTHLNLTTTCEVLIPNLTCHSGELRHGQVNPWPKVIQSASDRVGVCRTLFHYSGGKRTGLVDPRREPRAIPVKDTGSQLQWSLRTFYLNANGHLTLPKAPLPHQGVKVRWLPPLFRRGLNCPGSFPAGYCPVGPDFSAALGKMAPLWGLCFPHGKMKMLLACSAPAPL